MKKHQNPESLQRRCLLCAKPAELENLTDEHIFPYAIGGRLLLANSTHKKCNGKMSEEFEAQFSNSFALIRIILGIEGRTGKFPELETSLEINGIGHVGKIERDGKIYVPPLGLEAPDICMTFGKKDRQKVISNLQKKKIAFEEVLNQTPIEIKGNIFVPLDFIGTAFGLRTAAKAGYTALAFRVGVERALSNDFEYIRRYVYEGSSIASSRLFLNKNFQKSFDIGIHQHYIALVFDARSHLVHAIVRYFGSLSYYVRLNENYNGPDYSWAFACNAQTGEEAPILVPAYDNEFQMFDDVVNGNTCWDDVQGSADNLIKKFSHAAGIIFEDSDGEK